MGNSITSIGAGSPASGASFGGGPISGDAANQIVSGFGDYQAAQGGNSQLVPGMNTPFDSSSMSSNAVPMPKMPDMDGGLMGKVVSGATDLKDDVLSLGGLIGDSADEKKKKEAEKFTTSMCKQACDQVAGEADKKAKEMMDQSMGVNAGGGNLA